MTTLPDRTGTALLVIDVQVGVVHGAHARDDAVANIRTLVERAREAGVPVVWVQHNSDELPAGADVWQIVPELQPASGEPVIQKRWGDSFEETELEAVLAERQVGRILVTGAQTDACVRSTLHGALVRGYDTLLVSDAHTTEDLSPWGAPPPGAVIAHTNLYWAQQAAPGRQAGTLATKEVSFQTQAGRSPTQA